MADFSVFETRQFLEDLGHDFSGRQVQIKRKLQTYIYPQLRQNPHSGKNIKKLRDYTPDTWRYRLGDWRLFYTIRDRERAVFMLSADHRGHAYE